MISQQLKIELLKMKSTGTNDLPKRERSVIFHSTGSTLDFRFSHRLPMFWQSESD